MPRLVDIPAPIRPLTFHGVHLNWEGREQANGDCPFCGKEGKLYASVETGLWDCKSCMVSGNVVTWLRQLHEASEAATADYGDLVKDRGFLGSTVLARWGVARSIVTGEWLVPGYDAEGKLHQLYKYVSMKEKDGKEVKRLLPTPKVWPDGQAHGLHGVGVWNQNRKVVYICEGPWDGMALWEVMSQAKPDSDGQNVPTSNESVSLLGQAEGANVIAVPGAGVFQEAWCHLLGCKKVVLLYDNDHEREHPAGSGKMVEGAGLAGMKRVAKMMSLHRDRPESIHWLQWGPAGFTKELKNGYDVRDHLTQGKELEDRIIQLGALFNRVQPIPAEWVPGRSPAEVKSGRTGIEPAHCKSWKEVIGHWRKAMAWRQEMDDALSVMMAVAISTLQVGDQLFLQLIGDAGSGKTKLCDGMLVSKYCYALEHLTGFHSGWKDNGGDDYSLIARINNMTLITPEGDVLMSSPHFQEIMSQQRRIFDGTSGASYKNRKTDLRYTGLRTPWIIAGTPALMDTDQSRLGDRFLRIIIDPPNDNEKRDILRQVGYTALRSVRQTANCDVSSGIEDRLLNAYRVTGGYVNYLRENAQELINRTGVDEDELIDRCAMYADFVAYLRARPAGAKREGGDERHDTKELPTRLTHQLVRLTCCLGAVMGKKEVDDEIFRRVRKVSLDTAGGRTMKILRHLYDLNREGATSESIALWIDERPATSLSLLQFLRRIGAIDVYAVSLGGGVKGSNRWRMTGKFRRLYTRVTGE